jgi:hypothetical protein
VPLAITKLEILPDGKISKFEIIPQPTQRFLYVVLANNHFWDQAKELGAFSPSGPNTPNLQSRGTIMREIVEGPLLYSEYSATELNTFWVDESCRKVLEQQIRNQKDSEKGSGSIDLAMLVNTTLLDELNLENDLERMSID